MENCLRMLTPDEIELQRRLHEHYRKENDKDIKVAIVDEPPAPTKIVDVKLVEAVSKLSEADKIAYARGYKTFKTNGKSEYILVDNIPFSRPKRGTNFTQKKKKRKK